ncbi:LysM peptidoglycan-binding domain-containing protein, partial [Streptococcus mitis]|uniref:LysM peptidoglycan-binding domain-containing protein n=1 Tax=Streptococcus mitis TaxID=28037 RepID=UPI00200157C9
MRQTNVRGSLSLRGFRKLRTGAIVATGVILLGLGFLAPTVSASEQDGVWVARTVAEVKADIQNIDNLSHYTIKWGDTLSAISGATGLSVDSLVEINRIANRDLIFANNQLYFSEEAFLKDGNTEVKRQQVSIDNSGSRQSYEVETKTDTVTGEQTTTVKQTTPVVVETPAVSAPKSETSVSVAPKVEEPVTPAPKEETPSTPAPKVEEPSTPAPKADESVAPAPKADEPVSPAPKADEPAASAPKADEQLAPTSKVEEPATPAPKVEEPAASAPKSEEPTTPAPKAEEPTTPAPKVEEPATPAPKVEESVSPAPKSEAPVSPAPKSEEPVALAPKSEEPTTPAPKAEEPATPAPVTPSEEAPVTSGDTNSTAQPAGESGKSETKSEPSNTPSAEATNDSGNVATSSPVTDGTTSNTGTTKQPETPASKPEATIPKEDKLPTNQTGDTSNPVDSKDETPNSAPAPKEDTPSEEVAPKDEKLEEAKKDGKDVIEKIAASKHSEIEKVKDEAEKTKLKEKLNELKEEALAAINNAKDHDAAVAVADEYQSKIDEIDVPGEELPAPNYNKDNLTNGRNEGTIIDNGSTAIGHGSGEAPSGATQPASAEGTDNSSAPTAQPQPETTSSGTSSFRNAPSVQARARRVARSTSEPDGTVNISYNFAGMPDIHGFLSDPGEDNTVTIPAGTSEAQAKELVKEKIQAKIKDLAARGYYVKNDIIFEQDTTVKNYNYVVTFTKEATGTSGFRMAPAVQPRASRNRRS